MDKLCRGLKKTKSVRRACSRSFIGGDNQQLQIRERKWRGRNTSRKVKVPLRSHSTRAVDNSGLRLQVKAPYNFNTVFHSQLRTSNIKTATPQLISNINREIAKIHLVTNGHISTNVRPDVKPPVETVSDDEPSNDVLVPKDQWVYKTPDKQLLKRMENFKVESVLEPFVLQNNKKMKTIYKLNDEFKSEINMNMLKKGQEIPINLGFLKPICSINVNTEDKKNNQFITQNEEIINFSEELHMDRFPNTQSNKNGCFIMMDKFNSGVSRLAQKEFIQELYSKESPMDYLITESTTSPELTALIKRVQEVPSMKFDSKKF